MIDSNLLVQTEEESLLRDVNSKALINKNTVALKEYKIRKNFIQSIKEEKEETKERLAKLEMDMQDIKRLLIEIAELRK